MTAALVRLLDEHDGLADELIIGAAHEGEVAFLAQAFARRGNIEARFALEELLSANPKRIIALLRLAGASRSLSAGLLASVGDLLGVEDAAEAIGNFDAMTDAEVAAARAWLSTPLRYRAAIAALGADRG